MGLTDTLTPKAPPLRLDDEGVLRVGGTRVTLDTIIGAFKDGADADEIARQYDAVQRADVYAAIAYYLANQEEVEAYLRRREQQAEVVRQEVEARSPQAGIRERVLAPRRPA